ncbi:hypothetical protein DL768_003957 [Monosporascus sp. mg162]|nr:hypothetical protein DL768_003957 [Monosporascus sp. mg162]
MTEKKPCSGSFFGCFCFGQCNQCLLSGVVFYPRLGPREALESTSPSLSSISPSLRDFPKLQKPPAFRVSVSDSLDGIDTHAGRTLRRRLLELRPERPGAKSAALSPHSRQPLTCSPQPPVIEHRLSPVDVVQSPVIFKEKSS